MPRDVADVREYVDTERPGAFDFTPGLSLSRQPVSRLTESVEAFAHVLDQELRFFGGDEMAARQKFLPVFQIEVPLHL
jgi:hypothetical protein